MTIPTKDKNENDLKILLGENNLQKNEAQTPHAIALEKLHPFHEHPYKVEDNDEMAELCESTVKGDYFLKYKNIYQGILIENSLRRTACYRPLSFVPKRTPRMNMRLSQDTVVFGQYKGSDIRLFRLSCMTLTETPLQLL